MTLRTIHLLGDLSKYSAEPQQAVLHRPVDVVSVLRSWYGNAIYTDLKDYPTAVLLSGPDRTNLRQALPEYLDTPLGDDVTDVHVVAVPAGAGIEAALISWGMTATVAAVVSTAIISLATSLVVGAITKALAPKVDNASGQERPDEKPSFLYNGPENVIEQGYMVPVVYGRHMTGSVVVSAGISVEQIPIATTRDEPPPGGSSPTNPPAESWQWESTGA